MAKTDDYSSIADANRPNAGRIYDYLLGGKHNFEIDRQAAQKILDVAPFIPQVMRLIRWFLGEACRRLVDQGLDKFLDFASGLPTQDHIHEVAPSGTKVIYSDIDPVTVEYAKELLKQNPNTRYLQCHAAKPEAILESDAVTELFGNERKIAIGFNGICYFLTDAEVDHAMTVLHQWAADGSKLFLTDAAGGELTEKAEAIFEIYKNIQPMYIRTKEKMADLVKPWRIVEPSFQPLEEWLDLENKITALEAKEWGGGGFYGLFLEK